MDEAYESRLASLLAAVAEHIESGRRRVEHTPTGFLSDLPESVVRSRFGRVVAILDKAKCDLAGDANEYTPIYRLPDDILVEVWDWLSVENRIGLTTVSKRWRSLALQTPKLWRYIHISPYINSRRIMGLLSRAQGTPLHLALDNNLHPPYIRFPNTSWRGVPVPFNHPGPYPTHPLDISPYTEIANSIIGRAVVLQASVQIPQRTSHLGAPGALTLESLQIPMPWLHSLCLSGPSLRYRAAPATHDFFLFNRTTPRLRHVDFTSFHPIWSDPIYTHLTYIKIKRPYSPCSVKALHNILQKCPLLARLHLETVFDDSDEETSLPVVSLPALKACIIRDKNTSILRCFRAPQLAHLVVTTVNYLMANQLSTIGAPLIDFREIVEVDIFSPSSVISLRLGALEGLITYQVDYDLDRTARRAIPTWEAQQTSLLDWITRAPLLFDKVVTLRICPVMSQTFLEGLFELVPLIKTLELYGTSVRHDHSNQNADSNFRLLHVLGTRYCTQLTEIRISVEPEYRKFEILDFLAARAAQEGGCHRLGLVVVSSANRLGTTMHSLMAQKVDKLVWKQAKPLPSYSSRRLVPVPPPDADATSPTDQDFVPWDEDDLTQGVSRPLYIDPSNSYFSFPA